MKRLVAVTLALAVLALARPSEAQAEELKGRVVSVSGGEARVELEGEYLPNEGDSVAFSYEIPEVGPARAGTGKVTGFEGATAIVRVDAGESGPQAGFLATITSPSPRRRDSLSPEGALAGNWICQTPGGPRVLILRADGTASLNGNEVLYKSTATSLTFELDGRSDTSEYQLRGDVLTFADLDGNQFLQFKRADDRTAREALREAQRAEREISAPDALKQLVSTQGVWRQTDSDRNGVQDYWVDSIEDFHSFKDANGDRLLYIDVGLAKADYGKLGVKAVPKSGYYFAVIPNDAAGTPYSERRASAYAFCAWPAEYAKTGVHTYIVNEEGVVYQKDCGGLGAIDEWPDDDPTKKGWVMSE